MTLTAPQRAVVAAWVNAGGKLLCCVDYHNLLDSHGTILTRATDSSFYSALSALISAAGGSLTFGQEDTVIGPTPPWPKARFLSDPWTVGNTDEVEYDFDAGSSITGGTVLFAPSAKNQIVKQQCGDGWVVCFGSQNALWGNADYLQSVPTGYTAMTQFLEFFHSL